MPDFPSASAPPPAPPPSPDLLHEQTLVAAVRAGDAVTFKLLYERYAPGMFAFAVANLESREQAEDILQDIFLAIWRNRQTWEPGSGGGAEGGGGSAGIRTYLMRATYNRLVMYRRHLRVELMAHESIVRDAGSPAEWTHRAATDDALAVNELETAVARAVGRLPPRVAQVYRLIREQRLSYAEAAVVMGISNHTVEVHMTRALKALREQLRDWRRGS